MKNSLTTKTRFIAEKSNVFIAGCRFLCSITISSTAVAAAASEKVINGDMPSGLETNTEYVNITGGSRITGTFKVINDADNQTGAHGSALSIRTDEAIIIDGDGHVEIRTYNDNSYAHTNAVRLHNDGASLLIDKSRL